MKTLFDADIANAERIIIPSGDDNGPCIDAFQQRYDIEVPNFVGKARTATSEGRTFYKQKGRDIPWMISDGLADIGLTGSDSAIDDPGFLTRFQYQTIGNVMCRFVLLCTKERYRSSYDLCNRTYDLCQNGVLKPEQVATSFPRYFMQMVAGTRLPLVPYPREIRGGVESAVRLAGLWLGADLVVNGDSARDNDLAEIKTLDLVYPALIRRIDVGKREGEFCANR